MAVYLKKFSTHADYEAYIASEDKVLPNVSICEDTKDVHYNPYIEPPETRVVAKFNVTSTSSPTKIASATTSFSLIEIDGVEQPSVITGYTFDTTGEHTVKYTLTDPTSIRTSAFTGCYKLTSINIPNGVTSIGDFAFSNCTGLTNIDTPNSVTSIGMAAFQYCRSLTSIIIPDSLTSIGRSVFSDCSGITSVVIGNGVTSIESSAFYNCTSLTNVVIGNGVTSIGGGAFLQCRSLTSVTIPNSVTSIESSAFYNCNSLTSVTIPNSVTSIKSSAFQYCSGLISIVSNATVAPTISSNTFGDIKTGGTLRVPSGSTGYDTWMQNANYYLGLYGWTKVEQ